MAKFGDTMRGLSVFITDIRNCECGTVGRVGWWEGDGGVDLQCTCTCIYIYMYVYIYLHM